jgi:HTH-type transcriptional regulator/antitoxin MqsA
MVRFVGEVFEVEHSGMKVTVEGLSGWRCAACGEVIFDAESANRYAAAGDALVLRARRDEGERIRRIRQRLGLTQVQAAVLTGGGPNAFSRYETGKVRPIAAVTNLFLLLDAHPALVRELLPGHVAKGSVSRATTRSKRRGADPARVRQKAG